MTGITNFLENDGTLEAAQRIAGHAYSRTTKLYDRRGQKVLLEDMGPLLKFLPCFTLLSPVVVHLLLPSTPGFAA
jgi:hypothetical protein